MIMSSNVVIVVKKIWVELQHMRDPVTRRRSLTQRGPEFPYETSASVGQAP